MINRLSFSELLRHCLMEDLKDRRFLSLIPWKIILCLGIGLVSVYFLPILLENKSDYVVLISGLIAAQGIILGMSTNAIQHVVQNISTPGFSSFLDEKGILLFYLFFIQYFQLVGVVSLIILIGASILVISLPSLFVFKLCLGFSFGSMLYSLIQTADTSVLLRDIVYYRALYDRILSQSSQEGAFRCARKDE